MPYTITVSKPGQPPADRPKAVATIQEARAVAVTIVHEAMDAFGEDREALAGYGYTAAEERALDIPEGGYILPLPDGHRIDVELLTIDQLAGFLPNKAGIRSMTHAEILDAYNALDNIDKEAAR